MSPVRVRFAPSPTGLLHIGGLRTALYNYLLARKTGGTFILRIEDTDQSRFVPEAEQDILDSLAWAGLSIDEGPTQGGDVGPYRQSERKALYLDAAQRLVDAGHAYVSFETSEDVDAIRKELTTPENPAPKVDISTRDRLPTSLNMDAAEVERRLAAGDPHVIRLHVPTGETVTFTDLIRGDVSFASSEVDDQVLVKSDGLPTYHLANVVDDHEMGITHVIRGEEWLPSVPKHILLYRYLGSAPPAMAHLPLILSPTGGKLSKRSADRAGIPVNVVQYREAGYEPEAVVNMLALLGWNPGTEQEVFSLDELVEAFTVERIGRSGVQFSMDKLQWHNGMVLRSLPAADLVERVRPAVEARYGAVEEERLAGAAELLRERLTQASDLADATYLFSDVTEYEPAGVKKRWKEISADLMRTYALALEQESGFNAEIAETVLRNTAENEGVGAGQLIHPARLAVTGVTVGAGLFETMELLGLETCATRLRAAADRLQ